MNMTIKKKESNSKAVKTSVTANDYAEATEYIQCAISALCDAAQKSDVLARESIANLSVILMDLR